MDGNKPILSYSGTLDNATLTPAPSGYYLYEDLDETGKVDTWFNQCVHGDLDGSHVLSSAFIMCSLPTDKEPGWILFQTGDLFRWNADK